MTHSRTLPNQGAPGMNQMSMKGRMNGATRHLEQALCTSLLCRGFDIWLIPGDVHFGRLLEWTIWALLTRTCCLFEPSNVFEAIRNKPIALHSCHFFDIWFIPGDFDFGSLLEWTIRALLACRHWVVFRANSYHSWWITKTLEKKKGLVRVSHFE